VKASKEEKRGREARPGTGSRIRGYVGTKGEGMERVTERTVQWGLTREREKSEIYDPRFGSGFLGFLRTPFERKEMKGEMAAEGVDHHRIKDGMGLHCFQFSK
jgi:hypothetical protein